MASTVKYPGLYSVSKGVSTPLNIATTAIPLPKSLQKITSALSIASTIGVSIATLNPLPAISAITFNVGGKFLSKIPGIGHVFGGFGGGGGTVTKWFWITVFTWPKQIDAGNGMMFKLIEPTTNLKLEFRIKAVCSSSGCKITYEGFRGSPIGLYALDLPDFGAKLCMPVIRYPIEGVSVKIKEFQKHINDYMYNFDYLLICRTNGMDSLIDGVRKRQLPFNVVEGTQINRLIRYTNIKTSNIEDPEVKTTMAKAIKFDFLRAQLQSGAFPVLETPTPNKNIKIVKMVPVEDGLLWLTTKLEAKLATKGIMEFIVQGRTYAMNYYNREFKNPAPIVNFEPRYIPIGVEEVIALVNPDNILIMCNKFDDLKQQTIRALSGFVTVIDGIYKKDKDQATLMINKLPPGQKSLLDKLIPGWENKIINGTWSLTPEKYDKEYKAVKKPWFSQAGFTSNSMLFPALLLLGWLLYKAVKHREAK